MINALDIYFLLEEKVSCSVPFMSIFRSSNFVIVHV